MIDSLSVRAPTPCRATRGWDNAKKINGRKRHIAVDAMDLLLAVVITAAWPSPPNYQTLTKVGQAWQVSGLPPL